jgi:ArsR family transcriptional regulator
VRVTQQAARDAVVADALASGRALCQRDGSLARIAQVVSGREAAAHEFFARPGRARVDAVPAEFGAYLAALALLLPRRALAIDAGTGEGRLLDVLAPVYERVLAVDRSEAQLARARERVQARGYGNVTLMECELDSKELRKAAGAGADAVFAVRLLHHAPQPARFIAQLASLCAPGGSLVVLDYARHDDESMREQADAWLGFDAAALRRFARAAGLDDPRVAKIPAPLCGDGPDRHLPWQVLIAKKPESGGASQETPRSAQR